MSNDSTASAASQANFESLKLRPGTVLQIQQSAQSGTLCEVKLLAAVVEKGVMVSIKCESGEKNSLQVGETYIIRGFSGQFDFSFSSQATQVFQEPIPYAMLSYPAVVEAKPVRNAIRTKIALPATTCLQGKNIPMSVTVIDLNMTGAKLYSAARIGPPGEDVNLAFAVDFEQKTIDLALLSTIRYTVKSDNGDGYNIGVEFKDVSQEHKLVLHYMATHRYD